MRDKILVSFSVWMMFVGTAAVAGETAAPAAVEPAAQAAAARTLQELAGLTGQRLAGMPAADQMDKAAPGEGYAVKMVRLDELQRYRAASASDPAALLHDVLRVVYPVRVAGKVHGELVVGKVDGTWSARGFAGPARVQAMEVIRERVTSTAGVSAGSTMLVQVPALNIEFVAHRDADGLQLTPLTDHSAAGLKAGQTLPAARAFELLLPLAVQHNGLPT